MSEAGKKKTHNTQTHTHTNCFDSNRLNGAFQNVPLVLGCECEGEKKSYEQTNLIN
jgi:hypothetical protein